MDPIKRKNLQKELLTEFSKTADQLVSDYPGVKADSRYSVNSGAFTAGNQLLSYVSDNETMDIYLCRQSADWKANGPNVTYLADPDGDKPVWRPFKERVIGLERPNQYSCEQLARYWFGRLVEAGER